MKTTNIVRFVFAAAVLSTSAQAALTPDLTMYLRTSSGANGAGGAQECVNNSGAWGNEFRLGNECQTYGEFGIGAWPLKPEKDGDPMFRFYSNFAVVYENRTDWEAPSLTKTVNNGQNEYSLNNANIWVMRELYTEGGHFEGMPFTVWAGKRFYRWGDVHMMDFYPVAMSGPGGGITNYKTESWGTWSLSMIQNASANEINGGSGISTKVGNAAKTSLHLRTDGMPTAWGWFSGWLAVGSTPSTTATTGGQDYKAGKGNFLALKLNSTVFEGANNEWGVAYGDGVMSTMGPQGELVKDCALANDPSCQVANAKRFRSWENLTIESRKWSTQIALIYDQLDRGLSKDGKFRWMSIGVRPTYWFSDNISLAFQAGISNIVDEADGLGARNLMRFTVAPQVSLGKGFYVRPLVRAYYSRTQVSDSNKGAMNGTTAAGKNSLDSFGMQTEIWF